MTNKEKIKEESLRIEEDSLYSAKGHFYAGQRWRGLHLWVGGIIAFLSAAAGASAFSKFDQHSNIAGIISIIVVALTAVITFVNPNEQSSVHQESGNKYNALRNDVRIFHNIEVDNISEKEATQALKKLNDRRNGLNLECPQIPKWAFEKARKGIEDGEADYKVDYKQQTIRKKDS